MPHERLFAYRPALAAAAVWFAVPGLALMPFLWWQSAGAGALFLAGWAGLDALFCRRCAGLTARWDGRWLVVTAGRHFRTRRFLPRQAITGVLQFSTPLLRLCGGCAVVVSTPGAHTLLPCLSRADAERLAALLPAGREDDHA